MYSIYLSHAYSNYAGVCGRRCLVSWRTRLREPSRCRWSHRAVQRQGQTRRPLLLHTQLTELLIQAAGRRRDSSSNSDRGLPCAGGGCAYLPPSNAWPRCGAWAHTCTCVRANCARGAVDGMGCPHSVRSMLGVAAGRATEKKNPTPAPPRAPASHAHRPAERAMQHATCRAMPYSLAKSSLRPVFCQRPA